MKPTLRAVDPSEIRKPATVSRPKIARLLRRIADLAESGNPWSINGSGRGPICAVMVVVFGPDGEPTPFVEGVTGDLWTDVAQYRSLVRDADEALGNYREMSGYALKRLFPEWTEGDPDIKRYDALHAWWLDRDATREKRNATTQAAIEHHEAMHPWLCDCGDRFGTERGLKAHRSRNWRHRNEVKP